MDEKTYNQNTTKAAGVQWSGTLQTLVLIIMISLITLISAVTITYIMSLDKLVQTEDSTKDLIISIQNESRVFSQNGEDGIIETIFQQIGSTNKYYVEFGTEDGSQTNTRNLRENYNWNGLLMDGGYENEQINLQKEMIYWSNIIVLFEKYNVPKQFDLLSVDTDFKDFWIAQEILSGNYIPRVIISEINTCFDKQFAITVPKDIKQARWSGSYYFGASPMAFTILFKKYNYSLVYCEKIGVNCFWIHNDELSDSDKLKFNKYENILNVIKCARYGSDGGCHPKDLSLNNTWFEIAPLTNKDNDFYRKPFEMKPADLDTQRCR